MGVIKEYMQAGHRPRLRFRLLPPGSVLLPGRSPAIRWMTPNALLSAAPDGMSGSITYSVVDPLPASFNVTVTAQGFDASGNAVPITHVFNGPMLTTPPPPPVSATDVDMNQLREDFVGRTSALQIGACVRSITCR